MTPEKILHELQSVKTQVEAQEITVDEAIKKVEALGDALSPQHPIYKAISRFIAMASFLGGSVCSFTLGMTLGTLITTISCCTFSLSNCYFFARNLTYLPGNDRNIPDNNQSPDSQAIVIANTMHR